MMAAKPAFAHMPHSVLRSGFDTTSVPGCGHVVSPATVKINVFRSRFPSPSRRSTFVHVQRVGHERRLHRVRQREHCIYSSASSPSPSPSTSSSPASSVSASSGSTSTSSPSNPILNTDNTTTTTTTTTTTAASSSPSPTSFSDGLVPPDIAPEDSSPLLEVELEPPQITASDRAAVEDIAAESGAVLDEAAASVRSEMASAAAAALDEEAANQLIAEETERLLANVEERQRELLDDVGRERDLIAREIAVIERAASSSLSSSSSSFTEKKKERKVVILQGTSLLFALGALVYAVNGIITQDSGAMTNAGVDAIVAACAAFLVSKEEEKEFKKKEDER